MIIQLQEDTGTEYSSLLTPTNWFLFQGDYPSPPAQPPSIIETGLHWDFNSHPFPGNVNYSWNRGQLLSRINYGYENSSYYPSSAIYHEYEDFFQDRSSADIVYGMVGGVLANDISNSSISQPVTVYGKYSIWTGVS